MPGNHFRKALKFGPACQIIPGWGRSRLIVDGSYTVDIDVEAGVNPLNGGRASMNSVGVPIEGRNFVKSVTLLNQ